MGQLYAQMQNWALTQPKTKRNTKAKESEPQRTFSLRL